MSRDPRLADALAVVFLVKPRLTDADQCPDCAEPPFYRWATVTR